MIDISLINTLIGGATLILQIIIIGVILWWFYDGNQGSLIKFISRYAVWITFLLALGGMVFSLFYSNIIGYAPCELCWLQRIFLYPQVFILGLALWKKDSRIIDYSILLSVIGFAIALYHKYVEISGNGSFCASQAVACTKIYFTEFGYITIPVMALTSFAAMILVMYIRKHSER